MPKRELVYIYSRINGVIRIKATLWGENSFVKGE